MLYLRQYDMDSHNEETSTTKAKEGATISPKQNAAYELISRNLTEQELENPAVVKMIINESDRLQSENAQLKEWVSKYYAANTLAKILEEKIKTHTAFEVISTGTIAIGGIIAGAGLNTNPLNYIYLILGCGLIIIGIIAKIIKIT